MNLQTDFPAILDGSMLILIYLAYQLPLLLASGLFARRVSPRNLFEYLATAGLLYTLFMIAIPGVLGLVGQFNASAFFLASVLIGGVAFVTEREQPRLKLPPLKLKWTEFLLILPIVAVVGYQWRAYGFLPTVGTDALMYHLYYPAEWLRTGWIERISQPGIMTSTYPCYGELIFGWQMAGIQSDFFAKNFQFFFLVLGFFCVVAAGLAAGFRRPAALAAAQVAVLCGINLRNCSVGNTDAITGAFLLSGVAFLIIAARRNRIGFFLMAGSAFGVCAGTKLLGTMLAPCAFLAGAAALWFLRPACRKNLLWGLLTAVLTASPCFIANWISAGNPVFPVRVGPLFANYMTADSAAVGFNRQSWSFFVNAESNSLAIRTAISLLVFLAAAFLPGRKRSFRTLALPALGGMILLLLAIQLAVYPAITQARAIIPLVMLTGFSSLALFEIISKRLPPWLFALLSLAAIWVVSSGNFDYVHHTSGMLLVLAWGVPLLLCFFYANRKIAVTAGVLLATLLVLDGSYRFGVCNNVSSGIRRQFLGDAGEEARIILNRAAEGRALRIAFCSAYYLNYMGESWQNALLSIPVSESGETDNWHYRTLAEARIPVPYPVWLKRVRDAKADYLLVDTATYHAPDGRLELEWALAHPEHFRKLYRENNIALFEVKKEQ